MQLTTWRQSAFEGREAIDRLEKGNQSEQSVDSAMFTRSNNICVYVTN